MLKRIFLICMSLLFLLTSISFAQDDATTQPLAPDGSNLRFAKAMNIVDNTVKGDDTLTRVALARLVSGIILGGKELSYNGENIFFDVGSVDAPYVMTAYNAGILNGVGGGLFSPDENVTYIQFIKAMVVLMGRNEVALAKGGYPFGYYAVARELGLNMTAPPDMSYEITYDGVASVLKLMQNSQVASYLNNGTLVYSGKSYLEHYMGICFWSGIINGIDGITSDEHSVAVGTVRVGTKVFDLAESLINMNHLVGYRADVYFKNYGSECDKVFYIDEFDNTVVTIDSEDLSYVSDTEMRYYRDNKEVKLKINTSKTKFIYNNKLAASYTLTDLNPFISQQLDGSVVLIDNNGDRVYDVIRMRAYKTYVVDRVNNGVIYNKYYKNVIIDTYDLEKNSVVNVLMQAISPDLIEEGDLISVMNDISGNVQTIIVTIDTYEGTVEATESAGGRISKIKIDGIWFDTAYSLLDERIDKIKLGNNIKMYLNPEGRISDVNTEDYEGKRIAYLIDAAEHGSMEKNYCIKLLTAGGQVTTYDLADRVKLYVGNGAEDVRDAKDVLSWIGMSDGRYIRQPIIYNLDSKNSINMLRRCGGSSLYDGFYQYDDFDGDTSKTNVDKYYFRYGTNSFGAQLLISDSTVMFSVPDEANRDSDDFYTVTGTSHFVDSGKITEPMWAYGTRANNPVAEIMVINNSASYTDIVRTGEVFVVSAITRVYEDGSEYAQIIGFEKGKEAVLKADMSVSSNVEPGDIIRVKYDNKGIVQNVDRVFSYSGKALLSSTFNHDGSNPGGSKVDGSNNDAVNAPNRYLYGKAYYSDEYALTVEINNTIKESYPIGKFSIVTVDSSGRELKVSVGTAADILNELDHTLPKASSIFIHTRGLDCKTLVIYN